MKILNTHSTLADILKALKDKDQRTQVINELKELDPQAEELKGLKLFLEKNDYKYASLDEFINKDRIDLKKVPDIKKNSKNPRVWLRYAAILIPFLGISYLLLNNTNGDLYNQYYEKEVGLPVTMGKDDKILFNNLMNAFKDDSFKEAVAGFEQLLVSNPNNDTLHYFLGCSYLETGEIEKAENNYLKVNEISVFNQKREYRLALIYIKKEDLEAARKLLLKITDDPGHRYYDQAIKILNEPMFEE